MSRKCPKCGSDYFLPISIAVLFVCKKLCCDCGYTEDRTKEFYKTYYRKHYPYADYPLDKS